MYCYTTATITATEITRTEYSTKTSSDRSIDLCGLRDARHELFCVYGDFYASRKQGAEVKITVVSTTTKTTTSTSLSTLFR